MLVLQKSKVNVCATLLCMPCNAALGLALLQRVNREVVGAMVVGGVGGDKMAE